MWLLAFALVGCDDTLFNDGPRADQEPIVADWEGVVELYSEDCVACHSAGGASGGLDLETDPCAATVGVASEHPAYDGGLRVAPGDHESSILWHKIAGTGAFGGDMPPSGSVTQASVDAVAEWIDAGASCGDELADGADTGGGL